jgi:protein-arginine kinase activator protein McsA
MEKAICQECNKEFSYYRSTLRGKTGKFCSRNCYYIHSKKTAPYNKGKIAWKKCKGCEKMVRIWKTYCSPKCFYNNVDVASHLPKDKSGKNNPMFGKHPSKETREKMVKNNTHNKYWLGKKRINMQGENHPNWKGGKGTERHRLMQQSEYILWRTAVFMRDNYTCQQCGKREGKYMEADHIKPWSLYPELRYAIDNGRTLCVLCHRKTDTWGARIFKSVERVNG